MKQSFPTLFKRLGPLTEEEEAEVCERLHRFVALLKRVADDEDSRRQLDELTKTTFAGTVKERSIPYQH